MNGFESLFKWALAALASLWALTLGHLHIRIGRVEDRQIKDQADQMDRRAKLWEAVTANAKELGEFKATIYRDYPTKIDLKDTEARIIAAIGK